MTRQSAIKNLVYIRLTSAGRGAVASILVHGDKIVQHLNPLFLPFSGRPLSQLQHQPIIYGNWITPDGVGEGLILCPLDGSSAEIHCHGGDAAVMAITSSLDACGFRTAHEAEMESLTEPSPWRADLRRMLSLARTSRTAKILLNQYNSIEFRIQRLADLCRNKPAAAIEQLSEILRKTQFGIHLTKPWTVVLCGEPNVGKSSLINSIVGFARAIVHETPGTTRDVVSELSSINGWPVDLKDTAGLRNADNQIEVQGILKAQQEIQSADLIIFVTDVTEDSPVPTNIGQYDKPAIFVRNKSDLLADELQDLSDLFLLTSATSGAGVAELIDQIEMRLVPELPNQDDLFPVNFVQAECFLQVRELIKQNHTDRAVEHLIDRRFKNTEA